MSAPSIVTTIEMAQPSSADLTELFPEVVVHPHSEGSLAAPRRNIAHAMSWHWASRNEPASLAAIRGHVKEHP